MSKYLNISGDYKLSVTTGGTITLNTGVDQGKVVITGNLEVLGNTTTVNTTELLIEDRVITLNSGGSDTTGQISADGGGQRVSGLEIDRGGSDAYWVFDDNINIQAPNNASPGAWVGRLNSSGATGDILAIRTTAIDTAGGDLNLIGGGPGLVSVAGTTDYEKRIFTYVGDDIDLSGSVMQHEDALVNAQSVVDYVDAFFSSTQIQDLISTGSVTPTSIQVLDQEITGLESRAVVTVDSQLVTTVYADRTVMHGLNVSNTGISNTVSGQDLSLSALGSGVVKIDDVMQLTPVPHAGDDPGTTDPDAPISGVKLYAKAQGSGGTSIYFVNEQQTQDELISRRRAILFSMIF